MNGDWLNGVAVGVGVGWINATYLAIPGWANILIMGALGFAAAIHTIDFAGGDRV